MNVSFSTGLSSKHFVKKCFRLGSQTLTDDTLWTPAKTKSFDSVMRGSALPFCFPSHTGAGQTSLWEPKLFRHMRNNLLRGHFKLNQTTASKCLQETYTHSCWWDPFSSRDYSIFWAEERHGHKKTMFWSWSEKNLYKTLYNQVMPYCHAAVGCVAFSCYVSASIISESVWTQTRFAAPFIRCSLLFSGFVPAKIMFPLTHAKGGCRRLRAWF